ncbi:MAG: phage virion morphogenesis protein, partial [Ignavibacteriales bacterium]|nr:phage virion morphogenesis protein [Ignavibacteriales bacterium]
MFRNRLTGKRELYQRIASDLLEAVYKNFEAEGRPEKWKTLAPSTIRERRRKGYWPGKILQRQ